MKEEKRSNKMNERSPDLTTETNLWNAPCTVKVEFRIFKYRTIQHLIGLSVFVPRPVNCPFLARSITCRSTFVKFCKRQIPRDFARRSCLFPCVFVRLSFQIQPLGSPGSVSFWPRLETSNHPKWTDKLSPFLHFHHTGFIKLSNAFYFCTRLFGMFGK